MADEDEIDLENLVLAFEQWGEVVALQLQYIEALGKYKSEAAKAELTLAVAAQEWAVAHMKATVARELESSLRQMHRQRRQTQQQIERLKRHAAAAARICSGEDLSSGQLALTWGAYTVFERMTSPAVLHELIETPLPDSARLGAEYANPRALAERCPDAPASLLNVHALLSWLKQQHFVPRRGTSAYRLVTGAFGKIATSATVQIIALKQALQELEKGTYDLWQPVVIAALPDSVEARKIVRLGAK